MLHRKHLTFIYFPVLLLGVLLISAIELKAQILVEDAPVFDGNVNEIVVQNDTIYVGGAFNYILPKGYYATYYGYKPVHDTLPEAFYSKQNPNALVNALCATKNGGTVIGGEFWQVGKNPVGGLAHYDSSGEYTTLLSEWNFEDIGCLASYDDTLYIGGNFQRVGGRSGFAMYDNHLDTVPAHTPHLIRNRIWGTINVVEGDGKGGWYVGGNFECKEDGFIYSDFVHIFANGKADPFLKVNTDLGITAMLNLDSQLIIAGGYKHINGLPFSGVIILDTKSGQINSMGGTDHLNWIKRISLDKSILYMVADTIPSSGVNDGDKIIAFDLVSKQRLNWQIQSSGLILDFEIYDSTLFVGGNFGPINGSQHSHFARLDLKTGQPNFYIPPLYAHVIGIEVHDSLLFLQTSEEILTYALWGNQNTTLLPGFTILNDNVKAMLLIGDTLIVSGDIFHYQSQTRNNGVMMFDIANNWNLLWSPPGTEEIQHLGYNQGHLALAGTSYNIGGVHRPYACAISLRTGTLTEWNPMPNRPLHRITVSKSGIFLETAYDPLYIRPSINNSHPKYLAFVDRIDGYNVPRLTNSQLYDASNAQFADSTFYLIVRNSIGAKIYSLNTDDGSITDSIMDFVSYEFFDYTIDKNVMLVNGRFNTDSGLYGLASIDLNQFEVNEFYPDLTFGLYTGIKRSILLHDSVAFFFSDYVYYKGTSAAKAFAYDLRTKSKYSWDLHYSNPNAFTDCAIINGKVHACGRFTSIGFVRRNGVASFVASTGQITDFDPKRNMVNVIVPTENTVLLGGAFEFFGDSIRHRFAEVSKYTSRLTDWDPSFDNTILTISQFGNQLVVGGRFASASGDPHNGLAILNADSQSLISQNLHVSGVDSTVYSTLFVSDSLVFVGGEFTSLVQNSKNRLGKLVRSNGVWQTDSWTPQFNYGRVSNMTLLDSSTLLISGTFTNVNGYSRRVAEINTQTGSISSWSPTFNKPVVSQSCESGLRLFGGSFDKVNGKDAAGVALFDGHQQITLPHGFGTAPGQVIPVGKVLLYNSVMYLGSGYWDGPRFSNHFTAYSIIPKARFEVSQDGLCASDKIVYFNNLSLNATTYSWNLGESADDTSNVKYPTKAYKKPGTYQVQLIARLSQSLCDTLVVQVSVKNAINLNLRASDTAICKNDSVVVSIDSSLAPSAIWWVNDTLVNMNGAAGFYFKKDAQIRVGYQFGTCFYEESIRIRKGAIPTRKYLSYTTGNLFLNDSLNYLNWYKDGGSLPNETGMNLSAITYGSGDYVVRISDSAGCSTWSDTLHPNIAEALFEISDSTLCLTDELSIINKSTFAQAYWWHFGESSIDTSTLFAPKKRFANQGTYTVRFKVKQYGIWVDSFQRTILVHPRQKPQLAYSNDSFCLNDSLLVEAIPQQALAYYWMDNFGNLLDSGSSIYYVRSDRTLAVVLTDLNSCTDTSAYATFTGLAYPTKPQVTVNQNNAICSGTYPAYQWVKDNTPLFGETSPQLNMAQYGPGYYWLVVKGTNGCSNRSDAIAFGVTKLSTIHSETFRIYPNPANGHVFILKNTEQVYTLRLFDLLGQQVYSALFDEKEHTINSTQIKPGIYQLQLIDQSNGHRESYLISVVH